MVGLVEVDPDGLERNGRLVEGYIVVVVALVECGQWGAGGGGGSFNSGTNQDNQAGVNEGHGKVIITYIGN